ncbi:hypothetical protein QQY66_49340 [Streptomyces sp. DG2A-72]|uniref:hypothetical protein n=1 Tax=Streptomyces sp. DG2A-72 TaxID=3051386 RepID=UPI00265C51AF|nr:hypothetical protein [Streptomyces sp. DG2A-72]MDO0939318.1 hypothetical protein [Streptomyces sp. DG2A-72]
MHLDIEVNDLSSAVERAVALRATVADFLCDPGATRSASLCVPARAPDGLSLR